MKRPTILFSLVPASLLAAALVYGGTLWVLERNLAEVALGQKTREVETLAGMLTGGAGVLIDEKSAAQFTELLARLSSSHGEGDDVQVAVVYEGKILAAAGHDIPGLAELSQRPEVREALAGTTGISLRKERDESQKRFHVAVPLTPPLRGGVLLYSAPARSILPAGGAVELRVALAVLAAASVAVVLIGVAAKVIRPLRDMRRGADRLSGGDLRARVAVPGTAELASLAEATNRMASEVGKRLESVMEQRNEMEAVLASMVEGVVAVDSERKIISMNKAASALLGIDGTGVKGRSASEVIRDSTLSRFVAESMEADPPLEREVEIMVSGAERSLQVHGSMLRGADRNPIGALVVLNDVTQLRKLESVRRDFVINASHEIRTPVTSIKGFVETLLEGALDDRENVERFLRIISRHADRLMAIVEDLLDLSRIERESERGEVSFEEEGLIGVIEEAVEVCSPSARRKHISLVSACHDDVRLRMNSSLLVQAVINLVDNAIKYSDPGKPVEVVCGRDGPWATIKVRDEGCGIESEHLPRLFERFYRVDKARSRSLGGTGLGLAIVKHIVQAHRGSVIVESEAGKGSIFTIFLPSG